MVEHPAKESDNHRATNSFRQSMSMTNKNSDSQSKLLISFAENIMRSVGKCLESIEWFSAFHSERRGSILPSDRPPKKLTNLVWSKIVGHNLTKIPATPREIRVSHRALTV